jgi:hypothetical protein
MKTSTKRIARSTVPAALLALGMAIAGQSASAGTLAERHTVAEGQAAVTELGGNAKAVTYWTSRPEGAVVVTTVDTVTAAETDDESHAVVRLTSVLQPGQVQEISVPLSAGETQPVLRIERVGDQVSVSKITQ